MVSTEGGAAPVAGKLRSHKKSTPQRGTPSSNICYSDDL